MPVAYKHYLSLSRHHRFSDAAQPVTTYLRETVLFQFTYLLSLSGVFVGVRTGRICDNNGCLAPVRLTTRNPLHRPGRRLPRTKRGNAACLCHLPQL